MGRYLLFGYNCYDADGGAEDLVGRFDTTELAIVETLKGNFEIFTINDVETINLQQVWSNCE